jgi:hypothetical protein
MIVKRLVEKRGIQKLKYLTTSLLNVSLFTQQLFDLQYQYGLEFLGKLS